MSYRCQDLTQSSICRDSAVRTLRAALSVGDSADALLLEPQGRIDALVHVTRSNEDELIIDVDAGFGGGAWHGSSGSSCG